MIHKCYRALACPFSQQIFWQSLRESMNPEGYNDT